MIGAPKEPRGRRSTRAPWPLGTALFELDVQIIIIIMNQSAACSEDIQRLYSLIEIFAMHKKW